MPQSLPPLPYAQASHAPLLPATVPRGVAHVGVVCLVTALAAWAWPSHPSARTAHAALAGAEGTSTAWSTTGHASSPHTSARAPKGAFRPMSTTPESMARPSKATTVARSHPVSPAPLKALSSSPLWVQCTSVAALVAAPVVLGVFLWKALHQRAGYQPLAGAPAQLGLGIAPAKRAHALRPLYSTAADSAAPDFSTRVLEKSFALDLVPGGQAEEYVFDPTDLQVWHPTDLYPAAPLEWSMCSPPPPPPPVRGCL